MWISFSQHSDFDISYAVKISVGGINGLTGLAQTESSKGKQDYLAIGRRNAQLSGLFSKSCSLFLTGLALQMAGTFMVTGLTGDDLIV